MSTCNRLNLLYPYLPNSSHRTVSSTNVLWLGIAVTTPARRHTCNHGNDLDALLLRRIYPFMLDWRLREPTRLRVGWLAGTIRAPFLQPPLKLSHKATSSTDQTPRTTQMTPFSGFVMRTSTALVTDSSALNSKASNFAQWNQYTNSRNLAEPTTTEYISRTFDRLCVPTLQTRIACCMRSLLEHKIVSHQWHACIKGNVLAAQRCKFDQSAVKTTHKARIRWRVQFLSTCKVPRPKPFRLTALRPSVTTRVHRVLAASSICNIHTQLRQQILYLQTRPTLRFTARKHRISVSRMLGGHTQKKTPPSNSITTHGFAHPVPIHQLRITDKLT